MSTNLHPIFFEYGILHLILIITGVKYFIIILYLISFTLYFIQSNIYVYRQTLSKQIFYNQCKRTRFIFQYYFKKKTLNQIFLYNIHSINKNHNQNKHILTSSYISLTSKSYYLIPKNHTSKSYCLLPRNHNISSSNNNIIVNHKSYYFFM